MDNKIRASPLNRVVAAFQHYIVTDDEDGHLRSTSYRAGVATELRRQQILVRILYGITALVAFVLIGGKLPDAATVTILATTIPVSALSLPALSIVLGVLWGIYAQSYLNSAILTAILRKLHEKEERELWPLYVADTVSDVLWVTLLIANDFNLRGSVAHRLAAPAILYFSVSVVLLHFVLCVVGPVQVIRSAAKASDTLGVVLSVMGLAAVLVSAGAIVFAWLVPQAFTIVRPTVAEEPE